MPTELLSIWNNALPMLPVIIVAAVACIIGTIIYHKMKKGYAPPTQESDEAEIKKAFMKLLPCLALDTLIIVPTRILLIFAVPFMIVFTEWNRDALIMAVAVSLIYSAIFAIRSPNTNPWAVSTGVQDKKITKKSRWGKIVAQVITGTAILTTLVFVNIHYQSLTVVCLTAWGYSLLFIPVMLVTGLIAAIVILIMGLFNRMFLVLGLTKLCWRLKRRWDLYHFNRHMRKMHSHIKSLVDQAKAAAAKNIDEEANRQAEDAPPDEEATLYQFRNPATPGMTTFIIPKKSDDSPAKDDDSAEPIN